jgi:hypothetical protein
VLFILIVLNLVMSDPVYFLIARIDITGGSTGYYRAALIQAAIRHFNEWWLIGTDYTKDWLLGGGSCESKPHRHHQSFYCHGDRGRIAANASVYGCFVCRL